MSAEAGQKQRRVERTGVVVRLSRRTAHELLEAAPKGTLIPPRQAELRSALRTALAIPDNSKGHLDGE